MGYSQDRQALAQKQLQDYLNANRSGIDPGIARTRDYLSGLDTQRVGNTQDILSGVSARFGLDPNIAQAGADFGASQDQGLQSRREATLAQMRTSKMRDQFTKVFNQAMDQYTAAGYDRRASETYARQVAQDQVNQKHAAEMAEENRNLIRSKQRISDQYGGFYDSLNNQSDPVNPYEQAMIRALFGIGGTAIGYGMIRGRRGVGQAEYPGTAQPAYISPSDELRELQLYGDYS
jgi:cation transport regulator ChaB